MSSLGGVFGCSDGRIEVMALLTTVLGGVGLLLNFLFCNEADNENEVIDVCVWKEKLYSSF
jgi:hypothetical protein